MTTIARPVRRETATFYRGRALIVELNARTLGIRLKGTRDRLVVDYTAILELGYKLRWAMQQRRSA